MEICAFTAMEIEFLQSHCKGKLPKYLLFLNRYSSVFGNVIVTYSMFSTGLAPEVCFITYNGPQS